MSAKNCFIATIVCVVLFVVSALFDISLSVFLSPLIGFGFLVAGIYKVKKHNTIAAYTAFSDMSKFKLGMTKDEVRNLNSGYVETIIDDTNECISGICETCGGKIENGVCTYCGNKYDDNSKVTYLVYDTRYGERTFTFKGNVLTNTRIWVKPMENFL